MSIRPVDLQVMVQKSAEVNKLNSHEAGRSEVAQQQFAEKFQKEVENQKQQVLETNKAEHQTVDKDGRSGHSADKKNAGKKGSEKNKKDEQKNKSTSMFDIKV